MHSYEVIILLEELFLLGIAYVWYANAISLPEFHIIAFFSRLSLSVGYKPILIHDP